MTVKLVKRLGAIHKNKVNAKKSIKLVKANLKVSKATLKKMLDLKKLSSVEKNNKKMNLLLKKSK
jgi:hypothetical protein